ncbi:MAG: hypothetical protein QXI09_01260 [Candidatus Aenigmatarchaeota archaeon]
MEEIVISTLMQFFNQVITYSSLLLSSLIVIVIGFLVGKILSRIVEEILERKRIENYLFGKKIIGISSIFSFLVALSIYLIFIKVGIDILGISYISSVLETFINFIGRLMLFLVSLFLGLAISIFIKKKIEESEVEFKPIISRIVFYVSVYIVLVMSLPILGMDTTILSLLFLLIVSAVILPFSIALSFILKDELKPIVKEYLRKRKIKGKKK